MSEREQTMGYHAFHSRGLYPKTCVICRAEAAEQVIEDVREWAQVAVTRPDHPLLVLLAEYDDAKRSK
jgi:hypothetical protein